MTRAIYNPRLWRSIISIAVTAAIVCISLPAASSEPATRRGSDGASSKPAATAPAGPLKNLKIDLKGKRVIIDAKVTPRKGKPEQPPMMLEFLMCKTGVKEHETLLTTDVPPSSLHAALLVLGLAPGRPAQWITPAGKKPVFVSPAGAALNISVQWTDKSGKVRQVPVTDWMIEIASKKKLPKTRWIFVGSDFLDDGRYWADLEGLHISVTNFAAAVIDVPFQSTSKDAFREFAVNMSVIPPRGTPVKLIIQAVKGAQNAPAARITFNVDATGRIKLDGKAIAPENISRAVRHFLSRHADASADVRIDPQALVYDRERLREILKQSGLTRITFSTRELRAEILPRTPA
ncbi:MAG: hypothetical protein KAV00_02565, partial [Phycisphaerae bacterium]|nr:hypothetical protein [Phycisphaerae bacterium]